MDFTVNANGTLTLLEAVRQFCPAAVFVFTSTNKVYGQREHVKEIERETRYVYDPPTTALGEDTQLDLHSPYGCS